jgi:hypothetical protein
MPKLPAKVGTQHPVRGAWLTLLFVAPGACHAFDVVAPEAAISRSFTTAKYEALQGAFKLKA